MKSKIRRFLEFSFGSQPSNFKQIPIIINNFNRVTTLKQLIFDLESRGYYNIEIIDNNSSYPPLLEYYEQCSYKVHRLKKNIGFKALWKSGLWYKFLRGYYCYTDSDLSLNEDCPDDFMEVFYRLLKKYPEVFKVGFSLKINDLPDEYDRKQEVVDWESRFYTQEKEENVFIAPIDTTFALYRPFARRGKRDGSDEILRVGPPYQCQHLPWYVNSAAPSEEELFYINSVRKITHWTKNA
ncbi:glycosyltransferase family 2 protein [Salinimicrobium oceani]|uniref:glycosyltransferase family 2 protein n=1 Tax=Salinimicrobium oceani TaxID=2722702 RepID=UPI001ADD7E32|nr:glycosyltransferase family 2 protein [Salinimicrobium oceani]